MTVQPNKLRVLHASAMQQVSPGKVTQLLLEAQAARVLGIPFDSVVSDRDGSIREVYALLSGDHGEGASSRESVSRRKWPWRSFTTRVRFYSHLRRLSADYDIVLLRYLPGDPLQLLYVLLNRRPLAFVHHGFEVEELEMGYGAMSRPRYFIERTLGPVALSRVDIIVGVTQELVDYEVDRAVSFAGRTLVYPNGGPDGIDAVDDERGDVPEFLFVSSSFSSWHGLDLLVASAASLNSSFAVHVVGSLNEQLRRLVSSDTRFIAHGTLGPDEVARLARRCSLGISALAMWRKGMSSACVMKDRQYLSMGLPVFASHFDVFPESFPYFVRGEPTVSCLLQEAARFAGVSREDVALASSPYISKKEILRVFYEQMSHSGVGELP